MVKFLINQKSNGQHLRVTIEQKPLEIATLIQLQQSIQDQLSGFIPKDPEYLHLTLLHLGIPKDLFFEYRQIKPDLTLEVFMEMFSELLQDLYQNTHRQHDEIRVAANSLNLYGSAKGPAVALSIIRNSTIDKLHQRVFSILQQHIAKHLTSEPLAFIAQSRNLRHSPPNVFNPHITLGRLPARIDQLPPSPATTITLKQPYLAHVTVI